MPVDYFAILLMYAIPMYFANATPVVAHGKIPLDFNTKLFGRPLLGKGKTVLGTVCGIIAGTFAGFMILMLFPYSTTLIPDYLLLAFVLSVGALFGDLVKSFFKRRMGIARGEKWVFADQLDFIAGGLLLSFFVRPIELFLAAVLFVATFFVHVGMNFLAYKLKLKKVPW